MRFSEDFVQRVVEANNLVDFISSATQLKASGGQYMGRCPFPDHAEKTASFSVSESKQVYHCFGCKKSGNLITFLRDYHGMSFPQAIEHLADRANIALPVTQTITTEEEKRIEFRKQVYRANQLAMEYFEQELRSLAPDSPVAQYVDRRKILAETIDTFRLGYLGSSWDGLGNYLQGKGVTTDVAVAAGLIKPRPKGNGHFDLFRERLMFPIFKVSGEVIGFGGRIIEKGEPKYLNSPETPVFSKGKTLYGLNQTARYIRSEDQVIVVEGYMDLLAMFQAGFRNVAAPLGTALTAEHAIAISKMTKNIVVLFDGDSAGQMAAERSLPILLNAGLRPRGLTLQGDLDPDEFLQSPNPSHGPAGLKHLLEQAPDLFNLVVGRWTLNFKGSSTDKLALVERCQPVFESIRDSRLKDLYKTELAQKLQIPPAQLSRMLTGESAALQKGTLIGNSQNFGGGLSSSNQGASGQQVPGQKTEIATENEAPEVMKLGKAPKAERLLLSLAIKNRANLDLVIHSGVLDHLRGIGAKEIFQWILEAYRQNPAVFDSLVSLLTLKIDDTSVLFEADHMESEEALLLRDCMRKIIADSLKEQMDRLSLELKLQQDETVRAAGMQKLLQLQKDRIAIMSVGPTNMTGTAAPLDINFEIKAKDME